jgi:hypothetical protein
MSDCYLLRGVEPAYHSGMKKSVSTVSYFSKMVTG